MQPKLYEPPLETGDDEDELTEGVTFETLTLLVGLVFQPDVEN